MEFVKADIDFCQTCIGTIDKKLIKKDGYVIPFLTCYLIWKMGCHKAGYNINMHINTVAFDDSVTGMIQ